MMSFKSRMVARFLSGAVTLCAFTVSAIAADEDGRYAIEGVGITKCQTYVAALQSDSGQKYLYAGYINGYLTALNQTESGIFDLTPWQNVNTLGDYMRMHCQKFPDLPFASAATAMVKQLYGDRLTAYSEPQKMRIAGDDYILYTQTIERLQTRLSQLGLYKGKNDGSYNDKTRAAVLSFQRSNNMTPSGAPDQLTLHALLMSAGSMEQ